MKFHLKIDQPAWFKIGDWSKVESKILKIGEFMDEPDACYTYVKEMSDLETIQRMCDEAFDGAKIADKVGDLMIKGNGDCPCCGYPQFTEDNGRFVCHQCRTMWVNSEFMTFNDYDE